MDRDSSSLCPSSLECIEAATRFWGVLTTIVLWGVGVDLVLHHHNLGTYVVILAAILSILETSFAVNLFLEFLVKNEKNVCFLCWQHIQWLDMWKKTVLYLFLSIFCFIKPVELWLATIGGSMLIVLSFLYMVFTYKLHLAEQEAFDKECSYDRFEDLQDDIDDRLAEPRAGTVAEQETFLQL